MPDRQKHRLWWPPQPPWLLLFLIFCASTTVSASHIKLNVPRVRLPYFENLAVNYTLAVGDGRAAGCFKWTVSRPSIISLQPVPEDCPTSAIISTLPAQQQSHPTHTIVYAEELQTGEIVRCDVVVDKITSLAIVTETRELHLEEAPSRFTIRAYGANNNEFTTLEGVPFKWWLDNSGGKPTEPILRFIPFSESWYKSPPAIAELESRRLQGSQVLLEGLKTGAGLVMAKLVTGYKELPAASVQIIVIANLVLEPREIVVGVGAVFPLQLLQLKQGRFVEIPLPSPLYNLQLTNASVLALDKKSAVTALKYGDSSIILNDSNGLLLQDEERPRTIVYVREPKYLSISALPWKSNSLLVGVEYELQVEVLDEEGRAFYIGKHMHVQTTIDSAFFKITASSENGTHHTLTPLKIGRTEIRSVLAGMRDLSGTMQKLTGGPSGKLELSVYNPIVMEPELIVVGCESGSGGGARRVKQTSGRDEVQLRATGGDGNYIWTTSNHSVFTVQNGVLRAGAECGQATITVSMASNAHIRASTIAYHLPVESIEIPERHAEGEVKSIIQVPVVFYARLSSTGALVPLTSCTSSSHQLQVEIDNPDFVYEGVKDGESPGPACTNLQVIGNALGSARLQLGYRGMNVKEGDRLAADATLSTFNPLRVVEPPSSRGHVTVLALGASRQVVFTGGPSNPTHAHSLSMENATVAEHTELQPGSASAYYIYEVKCNRIGETNVTLHVGVGGAKRQRSATLQLICAEPSSVSFHVDRDTKCPAVVRVPVLADENSLLSVEVRDARGRLFDNITSLTVQWETSTSLLSFRYEEYVTTVGLESEDGAYIVPGKSLQTIIPKGEQGVTIVKAKVLGYRDGRSKLRSAVHHSLELNLVTEVVLDPNFVTIFNHPSYQATIHLRGGSGYFFLNSTTPPITKQVYYESNRTLLATPLQEGEGRIQVQDVCLGKRSTDLSVVVTGVGTLQLDAGDKLQLGANTIATIRVLGSGDSSLLPDLHLIEIKPEYNHDLLDVQRTADQDSVQFVITGKALGTSNVKFTSDTVGGISRSVAKSIQVFPPLSVSPEKMNLLAGAVYQYAVSGGPGGSDVSIQFGVDNNLATITQTTGLLHASTTGQTLIHASSIEKSTSRVYSEATANLEIVNFKGIAIHAPTTRILVGREMPVWLMESGSRLDPDSMLGLENPLISCKWESSNGDVGAVRGFWDHHARTSSQLRTVFTALKPGHATLKLTCSHNGVQYIDELEVQVLEELRSGDRGGSEPILLSPNTELKLKQDTDKRLKYKYSIESSYEANCIGVGCSEQKIISISNGVVRSYEKYGVATVLVYLKDASGVVEQVGGLVVEVKPVRYMLASPRLPVYVHSEIETWLPRGLRFPTRLTFHDDLGRTYDSTNLVAGVRPSRFDIVSAAAGVDKLELSGEGASAVKYHVEETDLRDFLVLDIAESIRPKVVQSTPGQIICFTCSVLSLDKRIGVWRSYDNLVINRESGVGIAQRAGIARVEYIIDGLVISAVDVLVVGAAGNVTLGPGPLHVTNGDLDSSFHYQLNFGTVLQGDCSGREIEVEERLLPFTCSVHFEGGGGGEVPFRAKAAFYKGAYECVLTPMSNETETVDSALILSVKFKEALCGGNCIETTKRLEFYPAVQIQGQGQGKVLAVEVANGQAVLTFTGLPEVLNQITVTPSNPTHLQIGRSHTAQSVAAGVGLRETRTITIKLLEPFWAAASAGSGAEESLTLQINSHLTRQRIQVPVRLRQGPFRAGTGSHSTDGSGGFSSVVEFTRQAWTLVVFCVLVVLVTLVVIHLASRYVLTTAPNAEAESVFLSSPSPTGTAASHQHTLLRERLSYSPSNGASSSGDAGYASQRLFSTPPQHQQQGDTGLYSGARSYGARKGGSGGGGFAAPWEK